MKAIADYGLIGDCRNLALVRRTGAIEWLAWPGFSAPSPFAALLGDESHGHWTIAPSTPAQIGRRYRPDTLILETVFEAETGVVRLIDFMPSGEREPQLVRLVRGERGVVEMTSTFSPRPDNGRCNAVLSRDRGAVLAKAEGCVLRLDSTLNPGDPSQPCHFMVQTGEQVTFVLRPSERPLDGTLERLISHNERMTERFWHEWVSHCTYEGPWREAVVRSLLTMKAMMCGGGLVAAATTSLPERLGGGRNWDYRFCWLRDSTFAILSMLHGGYRHEARVFLDWLLGILKNRSGPLQPAYGVDGKEDLTEHTADWLPGFGGSCPVRLGNDAYRQFQLGVYGEVFDTVSQMQLAGEELPPQSWPLLCDLLDEMCLHWREPDAGIWEQRSDPECFTLSRVLACVALDCAAALAERLKFPAPLDSWKRLRNTIHDEVCERGFDPDLGSFTRSYGSRTLDASLLLIPMVGFLPADDPRVVGTTEAITRDLMRDGFVYRYDLDKTKDGLEGKEGSFLACSFWLADNWILQGRYKEAGEMFERLLGISNDLGLLSEEYDPGRGMLLGNFPQLLTHLSLVHTAYNLSGDGPVQYRSRPRRR